MILFFQDQKTIFAVETKQKLSTTNIQKLIWLFADAKQIDKEIVQENFIGPRPEMITPWSTNAVEITQNMGIEGVVLVE